MVMAARIRRHIFLLTEGEMFSSQELLVHANRPTVDQTLHRLVRTGIIVRITRGIYMRETADSWRPSVEEVARMKAKIFAKEIVFGSNDTATLLGLPVNDSSNTTFICSSGRSSSFIYGDKRVQLKVLAARKLRLKAEKALERGVLMDFRPQSA